MSEVREKSILEEADDITGGARQQQYGPPEDSFALIATLWTAYIDARNGTLVARDVCMMMILLKVARDAYKTKRDNLVDVAGYARCAELVT